MQVSIPQLKVLHRFTGHNGAIYALSNAPEPYDFCSAGGDGWVVGWQLAKPDEGRLIAKTDAKLFSLCYIPERMLLLAGDMNGGLHWIDLQHPGATTGLAFHQKGIFALLQIGDSIFSAGGDGKLGRWNLHTGRCEESLQLCRDSLRCLDYDPQKHELSVGASNGRIYFIDLNTLQVSNTINPAHDNSVFSLAYLNQGSQLVSGGRDAQLKHWSLNVSDTHLLSTQSAHWYTINQLALHPSGQWLASASRDKTIKIWDATTLQLLKVLETIRDHGHINSVNALWHSPDGQFLLSAGDDRSIIQWHIDFL